MVKKITDGLVKGNLSKPMPYHWVSFRGDMSVVFRSTEFKSESFDPGLLKVININKLQEDFEEEKETIINRAVIKLRGSEKSNAWGEGEDLDADQVLESELLECLHFKFTEMVQKEMLAGLAESNVWKKEWKEYVESMNSHVTIDKFYDGASGRMSFMIVLREYLADNDFNVQQHRKELPIDKVVSALSRMQAERGKRAKLQVDLLNIESELSVAWGDVDPNTGETESEIRQTVTVPFVFAGKK